MASDKARLGFEEADVARLKVVMNELGLTQAALARRLGTSQATISKILQMSHRPRPALRAAIRHLNEVETDEGTAALIEQAAIAASRSKPFRDMLRAMIRLTNKDE